MADVSKLRLDDVTYDIKDDNARKYLVMVNEEPVSATKMVIETGDDHIELAYQEDVDNKTGWFVTPQMYGAIGDGTTDDSNAFQLAINSGHAVVVPKATYLVHDVTSTNNVTILGEGATVIPVYVNGIAKNIFTFTNSNTVIIEDIKFGGSKHGTTDWNVYRNSALEVGNVDKLILRGVEFKTIDDSQTQIQEMMRMRKGVALTAYDVSYTLLEDCHFDDLGSEEIVYISNRNKTQREICADIINCSSANLYRLSLFDFIGGRIRLVGFRSDSSDDFQSYSFANLLAYEVYVSQSLFLGQYGNIIDTHEANLWYGENVVIEDCYFTGYESTAITSVARSIIINRCVDVGCRLLTVNNVVSSDTATKAKFGEGVYETYTPCELIKVSDCDHTSSLENSSLTTAFCMTAMNTGGAVIFENNINNQSGIKGNAALINTCNIAIVKNNTLKNSGASAGTSTVAHIEFNSNCNSIILEGNHIDSNVLAVIIGSSCKKLKILHNVTENANTYLVRNFVNTYSVESLDSDTSNIEVYADNYSTTKGNWLTADWTATSSAANDNDLTDELTVPPGTYLIRTDLPASSAALLVVLYDKTHSRQIGGYAMIREYGEFMGWLTTDVSTKITVRTASSASVTLTNTAKCKLQAVPIQFV